VVEESKSRPGVEPWLRGTLMEIDPVLRAVLHALELAREDRARWAAELSDEEIHARPAGLPSVAFHLRHIARSLDRLLTYAEGRQLDEAQLAALKTEMDEAATAEQVRAEFAAGLARAEERVRVFAPAQFAEPRGVGRKLLPTTVAGLLVHCADHTQRHSGQMVTTAKLLLASRSLD
jgi:uncharacterized damage-inducible protein DinB